MVQSYSAQPKLIISGHKSGKKGLIYFGLVFIVDNVIIHSSLSGNLPEPAINYGT
jgi:hypothetical protein